MTDKKGSLSSPVKIAIIVSLVIFGLIVAFVVLGFVVSLNRNAHREDFIGPHEIELDIQKQFLKDLAESDKKITLPAGRIYLNKNEEHYLLFGVKNIYDDSLTLKNSFRARTDIPEFLSFTPDVLLTLTKEDGTEAIAKIVWDDSEYNLEPNEVRIFNATITAPNEVGNYLYEISLINGESEYESAPFFVGVIE